MVTLPVRHGKSELISKFLPVFLLGNFPDDGVLLAGHSAEFANEFGGEARELMETFGPSMFDVRVDRRTHAKANWKLAGRRGRMIARGVGGSFPGKGAGVFVMDDLVKSPAQAYSKLHRDSLFAWYTGIARSRLDPEGAIIVVMSRWHKDDITGRLMKLWDNIGEPYVHLHLPAIALENDPLGRAPGEALWPERYPIAELESIRREIGPISFNAQYQGTPSGADGAFFKRSAFRYFELRDGNLFVSGDAERGERDRIVSLKRCRLMQYVDLAASLKKTADYFVILTVAIDRARKDIYVLDVFRDRLEGPDQVPELVRLYRMFRPWRVRIESVAFQLTSVQAAIRAGLPAEPINRSTDKLSRANYIATRYTSGTVFHPHRAPWLGDFEDELVDFPFGAKDDQVDTIADAGNDLLSPEMDVDSDDMAIAVG